MGGCIESAESNLIDKLFIKFGMSVVYEGGYNGFKDECDFLCSVHGKFKATPRSVLRNELGCRYCGLSKMGMTRSSLGVRFDGAVSDLDARLFEDPSRYEKIKGLWVDMLQRCYGDSITLKSYADCYVSKDWMKCSKFYEDIRGYSNYEMLHKGWQLDKDLLVKGNRVYSKDTCCIVPHAINSALTKCKVREGNLPTGVRKLKNSDKYTAQVQFKGKAKYLGSFATIDDAFMAYKVAKQRALKELAEIYKNGLTTKSYLALSNYEVEILE